MSCHQWKTREWEHLYSDARLQLERGYPGKALEKAEKGFHESDHRDPVWNWKFRILKAEILLTQHKFNDVLHVLATPPPPELSRGDFAVLQKTFEATAHAYLRHYEEAEAHFKEADELASAVAPHLRCEVALFEGTQAYTRGQFAGADNALRENQYAIAEQRYQFSLQLARQYHQPYIEAGALIGLSITATGLGHFDEAIDWSRKSSNLAHAHQFRLAENYSIGNLAWSYAQLGDLENAVSNFLDEMKVIDALDQPSFKEHLLNNLGETYLAQRNYEAARESHLKALAIAKDLETSSDQKPIMVFALCHAAAAALEQNKLAEAKDYSHRAAAIDPNDPRTVLIAAKIEMKEHKLARAKAQLAKLLAATGTEEFVRWDAEDALANIFAAQHQNVSAQRAFQNLIDEVEAVRSRLRVVENRLAFSSHAGRYYDDYVRFLVATGQKRTAFQVAEFSRARILEEGVGIEAPARPTDISIEHIQAFLRPHNQVILAYWLAADKSYVWLISPSQFQLFPIAAQDEIEQKTAEYNKMLQGVANPEDLEQIGQFLYQKLIGPVEKLIPGKVVIIPDGGLSKLNFETLRVPHPTLHYPAPHYWIEDVETEITSSTTLLINSRKREITPQKLLLLGDPVQASNDYPALIHAGEELKRVEAHFSPDQETVFSGTAATPSIYQMSHPEHFGMIHFVTHGTAHELSPLDSAIILSQQPDSLFKLYARDVVNIPINADLVTISACYGLGKRAYSGEGLVGLAWAFLRAGAHQVVAGLWDVDDRASVGLMDDFYTQLPIAKSASAALRSAKLKLVNSDGIYSRPYYWASLQLYTGS